MKPQRWSLLDEPLLVKGRADNIKLLSQKI